MTKPFAEMDEVELLAEFHKWDAEVKTKKVWGAARFAARQFRDACALHLAERYDTIPESSEQ